MRYKYKITTPSENEMKSWVSAIQTSIDRANQETEKHYVIAEKHSTELMKVTKLSFLRDKIQNNLIISKKKKIFQNRSLKKIWLSFLLW